MKKSFTFLILVARSLTKRLKDCSLTFFDDQKTTAGKAASSKYSNAAVIAF